MRFHVLGLPHTAINEAYVCCAYSMKLRKWAFMMAPRGHEVILYSNEGADVPCENVQIFSETERQKWFGPHDPQKLYHLLWDPSVDYWRLFNERCIEALIPRVRKGDFILTCAGNVSQPVGNAFPGSYSGIQQTVALVEAFIGYYGTFSRYRVYESHAHREWLMGAAGHKVEDNSTAVVENYWDLKDFVVGKIPKTVQAATKGQPYYLYIGRIIPDKGWGIAVDATRDIGARLIMAGQGDPGEIRDSDHVTFFGAANVAERAALMSGAIATFCPTHFREPFGGTAVETQLCGTPAITTDHGAFTQTVEEKWRCANHREFVAAARRAQTLDRIDRHLIKQEAEGRYSLEAIAPKFERYFQRLIDLWGEGWYAKEPYKLSTEETESKCQARPEVKSRARLPSNFHLPDPPGEPYESSRHMAQHIFDGEYDPRVRMKWDTLHKSARLPSDVKRVIDIGSNMGAFAVWARAKWKNARVECFEPNPAAADFCERNAPFAKIHRSAVTVESTATLWIDETWGASRTFESKLAAGGNRIDVPVVHPKNLSPTDVLKIDAEGVEPEIIKHYPHLAGLKMCVYEYHRAAHRDELYGLCERAGLRCVRRIVYSTDIGVDIWIGSKPSGKKRRKR